MSKAPGHREWPDHEVREEALTEPMKVVAGGEVVAESSAVVRVREDHNPDRFYFPRSDIRMEMLEPSPTTSRRPFKGTARYFHLEVGDKRLPDAAWSYEEPFEEHEGLKERIAFYADELPEIEVEAAR
jgi:uncharacterized protein (DUF427 family)